MKLIAVIVLFALFSCSKHTLPKVELKSSIGSIILEIDTINAPITAGNFLSLVERDAYNNGFFYRVVRLDNQPQNEVKIEVIQGGLKEDKLIEDFPTIAHENTKQSGLKHLHGTISMARNEPGSASTEFFICINNQPELDFGGKRNPDGQGFAAFGRVLEGMETVLEIQQQADEGQYLSKPITIYSVSILE